MSADNGIYIAEFPNGEMRVAHGFDSVINELETHYYTPEDYRDTVMGIFDGPVFTDEVDALQEANKLLKQWGYTEYGICFISLSVNYGELKAENFQPTLSEGACPHCSTVGYSETFHGGNSDDTCRDPSLPRNILVKALREQCSGINEHYVVRVVLETLEANGFKLHKMEVV